MIIKGQFSIKVMRIEIHNWDWIIKHWTVKQIMVDQLVEQKSIKLENVMEEVHDTRHRCQFKHTRGLNASHH
jgi:hypothetical protein